MAVNWRIMHCEPRAVFDVLANGWLYPSWVVGASRIRGVDAAWPAPGSVIHHSVGVWPALLNDSTSVVEWDPPRHALLKARGWPVGEARITIDVREHPAGCRVLIREEAVTGPARLVPPIVANATLRVRNIETLRRLAYLAEGGAGAIRYREVVS